MSLIEKSYGLINPVAMNACARDPQHLQRNLERNVREMHPPAQKTSDELVNDGKPVSWVDVNERF